MLRTQISITEDERAMLDRASASTGRSMSSLIREAVREKWGGGPATAEQLDAMRSGFGAWKRDDDFDSVGYVDELRSHDRLVRDE